MKRNLKKLSAVLIGTLLLTNFSYASGYAIENEQESYQYFNSIKEEDEFFDAKEDFEKTEVETTTTPSLRIRRNAIEKKDFSKEINDGIYGLNYDRDTILARNGESVESFVPKEGIHTNDKFIVVERKKKNIQTTPVDISIIDSITDRTYPGALQLANKNFTENRPDLLVVDRAKQTITIDLPGLQGENSVEVKEPNYANISSAIDTLTTKWFKEQGENRTLPARTQYSESMVYSKSQIEAALNVNSKILENSLGVDFKAVSNGEKKVMIASYKQIFYTVSAQLPKNPSDVFGLDVSYADLIRKGVSNFSPPLMVSNVSYGRTIFVKLETNSKSKDVEAAFSAVLKNADVKSNAKYNEILNQSSFTAVVLGGDAKEHNKIVSKDFEQIRNIIKDNAQFSQKNPAYPISYTSVFLKDNSIAAVQNRTEYIETKSTEYSQGKISLKHTGWYVAQFVVDWEEVSYDSQGKEIITKKYWDGSWKDKTAPYSTQIPLPANARNVRIYAREATGLAWDWWRVVVDENNLPLSKEIQVSIWGTTLNPNKEIKFINN